MLRVLVIAIALGGSGCGDRDLDELKSIRTEMCDCKTVACGEAVMERVPQHVQSDHRAQAVAKEILDCMAKLHATQRPSTDPDDEVTEP